MDNDNEDKHRLQTTDVKDLGYSFPRCANLDEAPLIQAYENLLSQID